MSVTRSPARASGCPGGGRQVVSREEDTVSLELADRALGFALAAGAAEAEAVVMREDGALTRFANSEIHQNVAQREVAVNLRVVIGKRVGVASSGRSDDEGLRTLAANGGRHRASRRGAARLGRPRRAAPAGWQRLMASTPTRPRPRRSSVPTRSARSSPPRMPQASQRTARSRPAPTRRPSPTPTGSASHGSRTTAHLITVSMGDAGGTGYAEAAAVDATNDRPGRDRPRGRGEG